MLHKLDEVVNFDKNTASQFFTKSYFKYSHLGDNLEFIGPVKIKLDKIIQEDTITKNIGRPERHTTLELQNIAKDLASLGEIRARLMASKKLNSLNFSIDVVNNIAYISGIASNEEEVAIVSQIAQQARFIKEVQNFVKVNKDKR